MLSKRVQELGQSLTLAITAKAKALKAQGERVVIMASGEPDFDTPDNIKEAAKKAIDEGFTKYTATSGIDELKELICEKFRKENNIDYKKQQIMITVGGKQAIYEAVMALIGDGDEVIVPSPYWVSYLEQIRLAGGRPVLVDMKSGKLPVEEVRKKISPATRLIILNSPNNPTGSVIDAETLREIAALAVEKKIYILSDEVYERFIYGGASHFSIASCDSSIKELTLTLNAFSKTYSMTGWRVGYCAGPEPVIKAMCLIQDHSTSNTCSIAQKAAVEALRGSQDSVAMMVREFEKRRNYMVERLNAMPGISCPMPPGAFYAFANVSSLYHNDIKGSMDFAAGLLDEMKVAVIPGIAFGDDEHIRLSYAASMKDIEEGMNRMEEYAKKLDAVKMH